MPVQKVKTSNRNKKLAIVIAGAIILVLLLILLFAQVFADKVQDGDTITVEYTGYLDDGTVFDSSLESVGLQAGLDRPAYAPLTFTVGEGKLIPGFEENVKDMSKGEKKRFTLSPEEGYGPVRNDLILNGLNRTQEMKKYSVVNVSYYKTLFNDDPVAGTILNRSEIPWQLKVVNISNDTVYVESVLNVGDKVDLPSVEWETVVISVDNGLIVLKQNPTLGQRLAMPSAQGTLVGVVTSVTDEVFNVDANHPFAGKNLTFEIEIKTIEKAK